MGTAELFRTALHSLRMNPLRSALSVVGVVFGIAAVVFLVSIGQGVRSQVTDQIKSLGTDLVVVKSGLETSGSEGAPAETAMAGTLSTSTLTDSDVKSVSGVKGVKTSSGTIEQLEVVQGEGKAINARVVGGGGDLRKIRKISFARTASGWTFDKQEKGSVAVGPKAAELLFGSVSGALGKTIRIGQSDFTVKAVLSKRPKSMFADPNKELYISLEDARALSGGSGTGKVREINAIMENPEDSARIKKAIIAAVEPAHRERFLEENPDKDYERDFYVATQDDLMKSYKKILGILNALVLGIALVALVESGVGVSNIMYITVKERTREIGVRLAQGASKRTILAQFLIESVTICLLGAAIGVPLGWLAAALINKYTLLPAMTPLWGVLMAFGAALAVGVVAGVYPAWKATQADIAIALRAE